ncbi:MAG: NosD domain-containing protein [Candidatus Bathyarchaeota archaeon]
MTAKNELGYKNKMRKKSIFLFFLICSLLVISFCSNTVEAQEELRPIIIRADGSIEGTDKIQRIGNIYFLIGNIEFTESSGPFLAAITIQKDQITLDGRGFKLQNFGNYVGAGIDLAERYNVTVKNFQIIGFSNGINFNKDSNELKDSSENTVINNTLTAPSFNRFNVGIWVAGSTNNKVINNEITGYNQFGIYVYFSNYTYLSGNVVTDNNVGISLDFRCENTILRSNHMFDNEKNFEINYFYPSGFIQDIDTSNTVNSKPIYYWLNQHNKTVPSDAGFVALVNCSGITVQNLNIENNENGITLYSTNNSVIKDNNLYNCGNAIEIRSCHNLTVSGDAIYNSSHSGVRISKSSYIQITENYIESSSFGITLSGYNNDHTGYGGSNNVSILLNNFTGNNPGIDITFSTDNVISGNSFVDNQLCIRAVATTSNLIVGNNFTENSGPAIYLSEARNNTFYHNNFINNSAEGTQISWYGESGGQNIWDNGYEGNFWSNQNITDNDGNGINDNPYIINSNNQDNYPITKPINIESVVIPEFPSSIIQLIFLFIILFAVIKNRLFHQRSKNDQ